MSTTAKIFVVLLALFSVFFAAVAVTYVSLSTDYKKEAQNWKSQATAARVEAASMAASAKATMQQLQGQISQLTTQIEHVQAKISETESELGKKNSELTAERSKREAAEADAKRVLEMQDLDKKRADRLEARNKEMLDQTIDLQKRNLDLNKRVKELTQQVTILDEQVRALKEQRYALEQQLSGASKAGRTAAAPVPGQAIQAAAPAVSGTPIRGKILEVKGSVASISVGSADGVAEGMSFIVYRGKDYLGKLKITTVEPNRAGGDLTLVRGEIRPQDRVADERSFGAE